MLAAKHTGEFEEPGSTHQPLQEGGLLLSVPVPRLSDDFTRRIEGGHWQDMAGAREGSVRTIVVPDAAILFAGVIFDYQRLELARDASQVVDLEAERAQRARAKITRETGREFGLIYDEHLKLFMEQPHDPERKGNYCQLDRLMHLPKEQQEARRRYRIHHEALARIVAVTVNADAIKLGPNVYEASMESSLQVSRVDRSATDGSTTYVDMISSYHLLPEDHRTAEPDDMEQFARDVWQSMIVDTLADV